MNDTQTKVCTKCKVEKDAASFGKSKGGKFGIKSVCKICACVDRTIYREKNKDKIAASSAAYYAENKDRIAASRTIYLTENKDKIVASRKIYYTENRDKFAIYRTENKEKIAAYQAIYYTGNKDKIAAFNAIYRVENKDKLTIYRAENKDKLAIYWVENKDKIAASQAIYRKNRLKTDDLFAVKRRIRCLVANSLKNKGYTKKSSVNEILGCSYEEFKTHIESQFLNGMSWENRNEWHIDHFIPLASAKTESEILKLNHYTNLRPMWAIDNIRKGAKMPPENNYK
jgi:hypothetical protein